MMPGPLPITGERTAPGIASENYWYRRHEVAYVFAASLVAGRTTLDVGCGEGYGSALLAGRAARIVALDYDRGAIAHAAAAYPSVSFVRANLAALPAPSAAFDVVVTMQVIEHVWDHAQFLRECLRVLRPGGTLLVTTPNRLTFSPGLDAPVNPFHSKEFTADELTELLRGCGFAIDAALGVHAGEGLRALDSRHGGSLVAAQLAGAPDTWSGALRRDVASVRAADFAVLAGDVRDVDESLDLVVRATRPAVGPEMPA